jgi:hypothetical protein
MSLMFIVSSILILPSVCCTDLRNSIGPCAPPVNLPTYFDYRSAMVIVSNVQQQAELTGRSVH